MVLGHQGEAQVVAGLCAEQLSGDLQMAEPWDPRSPQHAREVEISWEAALRQRGDGKSDVVNEQCGQRNEL